MRDTSLNHKKISPTKASTGNKKRKGKKKKPREDSTTRAYPSFGGKERKHGTGIWGGRREVTSIRLDTDLYHAFKPVAMHYFGSVCRPMECFMASVLGLAKEGVSFSNTITIEGGLHVERNLRPRRKLVVDESIVDDEVLNQPVSGSREKCAICGQPSYVRCINKDDSQVWLCRQHFKKQRRSFRSWRPVKAAR